MVRRRVSRPRWVGGRTKRLPQGQGPRRQTNPTLGSGGGSFKMTRRYKTFGKSKEGKHDLAGQRPKNFRPAGAAWRGGPGLRPRPRPTDRLGRDPGTGDLGRDLTGTNSLKGRSPGPQESKTPIPRGTRTMGPSCCQRKCSRAILFAYRSAYTGSKPLILSSNQSIGCTVPAYAPPLRSTPSSLGIERCGTCSHSVG